MKKVLILFMVIVLAACGSTSEDDKEIADVEKEVEASEEEGAEEADESSEAAYDEVLFDSHDVKVTLESIATVEDSTFDEEYHEIKLHIENDSDETIVVQADEVSIDGLMVTDNVFFSEEVSAGKVANGKIKIQFFDEDLPPLEEELEMTVLLIDEETYDRIDTEKVNISIK